jgi:hypothetical protein
VVANSGGKAGQCNVAGVGIQFLVRRFWYVYTQQAGFGWKAMTQNLTFSDLFIFAAKRAYIVATVNDAIQTMR